MSNKSRMWEVIKKKLSRLDSFFLFVVALVVPLPNEKMKIFELRPKKKKKKIVKETF